MFRRRASGRGLQLWGVCLYGVTVILMLQAAGCMMALLYSLFHGADKIFEIVIYTIMFLLMGTGSYFFRKWGKNAMTRAATLDTGIPFTRANTADLPAPESLVRASAEPVQEPQAVLLRAAAETREKHEEQLLRGVTERECIMRMGEKDDYMAGKQEARACFDGDDGSGGRGRHGKAGQRRAG